MAELSEAAQEYLASVKTPIDKNEFLCTVNGRFVHRMKTGAANTKCGALPSDKSWDRQMNGPYHRGAVPKPPLSSFYKVITPIESLKMHVCGKCWPK